MLWGVMDFEAFSQTTSLHWREGFVERGEVVRIEIIHHQPHLDRVGVALIAHGFDEPGPILPCASFGDLDVAPAGQGFDFDEQRGHAVAHIFVIDDASVAWRDGDGRMHFAD